MYKNHIKHKQHEKQHLSLSKKYKCQCEDKKLEFADSLLINKDNNNKELEQAINLLIKFSAFPTAIVSLNDNGIIFQNQLFQEITKAKFKENIDKLTRNLFLNYDFWEELIIQLENKNFIDNFVIYFNKFNQQIFSATICGRTINYAGEATALIVFTEINDEPQQEIATTSEFAYEIEIRPRELAASNSSVPIYLMERALSASSNGIVLTDATQPDNPIIYVNPAFEKITGYSAGEVLGRNCRFLQSKQIDNFAIEELRIALREAKECHVILNNCRKDGTQFWNELYIAPVFDQIGQLTHFIGIQNDITQHIQALETLKQQEEQYRRIVETATEGIWLVNQDNKTTFVNQQMANMLGYTVEEMLGETLFAFMDGEGVEISQKNISRRQQGIHEKHDFKFKRKDGSDLWVIISCAPLFDEESKYAGALGMVTDISDRKKAEDSLRESKQRLDGILNTLEDVVWSISADNFETLYINPTVAKVYGCDAAEFFHNPNLWFDVIYPEDRQAVSQAIEPLLSTGNQELEYRIVRPDGQIRWLCNRSHVIYNSVGKPVRIEGIATDITERKCLQEKLVSYAFYDHLTGLPNRVLFMDRLAQAINEIHENPQELFAVLFLDLDRFKVVNDSLGHIIGDQLLVNFAQRLQNCLQPEDTVARLGGDEFTILISGIKSIDDVTSIAEKIQQQLKSPFNLNGHEVFTTASIGIALSSCQYTQAADLLRDADTALYRTKEQGKAGYTVFDPKMYDQAVALLQLETDLRWAISRQELEVVYQPIVCVATGRLTGFEALVRWQHPQRGLISPAEFIPIAEETGLIIPIGEFVLRESCQQLKQWHREFPHLDKLPVNVNLSGKQLSQACLVEQIQQVLAEIELEPSSLKLEITESAIMSSPEQAAIILKQLRNLGIKLCIDDFGTGYSSLAYLHNFPIDVLKMDRSFVSRIDTENEQLAIIHAIITLAHNLGIKVVAEGVESSSQLLQLKLLKCDQAQGYLFFPALCSQDIRALLALKSE